MSPMEREKVTSIMQALSEEGKRLAIKQMPDRMLWDELYLRYKQMDKTLKQTQKAMRLQPPGGDI